MPILESCVRSAMSIETPHHEQAISVGAAWNDMGLTPSRQRPGVRLPSGALEFNGWHTLQHSLSKPTIQFTFGRGRVPRSQAGVSATFAREVPTHQMVTLQMDGRRFSLSPGDHITRSVRLLMGT